MGGNKYENFEIYFHTINNLDGISIEYICLW